MVLRTSLAQWRLVSSTRPQSAADLLDNTPPANTPSFGEFNLPASMQKHLTAWGITAPTPIQSQAWALLLGGANVVGVSPPNSGKKLAYVVPALMHALTKPWTVLAS